MPILFILVGVVVEETTASILEMHKSEKSNRGMEKENMKKKKKKREKNILIGCRLAKVGKASAILTEVNGCGAVDIYAQFLVASIHRINMITCCGVDQYLVFFFLFLFFFYYIFSLFILKINDSPDLPKTLLIFYVFNKIIMIIIIIFCV